MFFKTEEEKQKSLEAKEKQIKKYEKIEKKLFGNIDLLVEEIKKDPSDDLRFVIIKNQNDFLDLYSSVLPNDETGDEKFQVIFDFIHENSDKFLVNKQQTMVIDFKKYLSLAIEKNFTKSIDSIVAFYEDKMNLAPHLNFFIYKTIVDDNNGLFLRYLIKEQGEDDKRAKLNLSTEDFFNNSVKVSAAMYGFKEDEVVKYFNILKDEFFKKEKFQNLLVSKMKVFVAQCSEIRSVKDIEIMSSRLDNFYEIFYCTSETTLSKLVYSLKEKKQADTLFSFIKAVNYVIKLKEDKGIYHKSFSDELYHLRIDKDKFLYEFNKIFLSFVDNEEKRKLVNNSFSNISRSYNEDEVLVINTLIRQGDLSIKLEEQNQRKSVEVKSLRKKI